MEFFKNLSYENLIDRDNAKVNLDGTSVMTGDIQRRVGNYTVVPYRLYEGDRAGAALVSQSGGLFVAGSGESPVNLYNTLISDGKTPQTEEAYFTSDSTLYFVSNAQNVANRKTATLDTLGIFNADGFKGPLTLTKPNNYLPDDGDTVQAWGKENIILCLYTQEVLTNQPSQYGFLLSISNGATEVTQWWFQQVSGHIYGRSGNGSGWNNNGQWIKLVRMGDTLTEDFYRKIGDYTFKPITTYEGDAAGAVIAFQSGGLMFMGSGESANNAYQKFVVQDKVYTGSNEQTFITSDNGIHFITDGNTDIRETVEITNGGNIKLKSTGTGLTGVDSSGFSYPLVWDNGSNLWIGAQSNSQPAHKGQTIISSGYNGSTGGFPTVLISVPNRSNTGGTAYNIIHSGASNQEQTIDSVLNLSSDLKFTNTRKSIYNVDQTGFSYPIIIDNGTNLWIGALDGSHKAHTGKTMISAGHDGTKGYDTIMISVPNDDNTGSAGSYSVIHSSANGKVQTIAGTINLTNATDIGSTFDANGALIIGPRTGQHITFDNNEIVSKSNRTTLGQLSLNESMYLTPDKSVLLEYVSTSAHRIRNIQVQNSSGVAVSTINIVGRRM